jgi:glycogen debranching enzyme
MAAPDRRAAADRRTARSATGPDGSPIRYLAPRAATIEHATDLGSVQVLKHANLFLLTDPFGDIHPDSRGLGLYAGDTRILSCSILRIGGERPVLLQGSMGGNYRGTIHLTNPSLERDPAWKVDRETALARQKLGITRQRLLSGHGFEETVTVVNHSEHGETVDLELGIGADLADIFEVRGYPRERRGEPLPTAVSAGRLTFRLVGLDRICRSTHIAFTVRPDELADVADAADTGPGPWPGARVRLRWGLTLSPGGSTELGWTVWTSERAGTSPRASTETLFPSVPRIDADDGAGAYRAWTAGTTGARTDHELFNLTYERGVNDLRLLINDGPGDGERYVAAGVPWFTALFGRDAIITALQALAFRPQLAVETLAVLAARQATELDESRDAEPGKILHELRTGEMARTGELPFRPYYGSVDATPLWLILFGATFEWTGDRRLVDRLWPNAIAALRWIDEWGDRDRDGFVEYERRAPNGLYNQGWKDSGDSVRYRSGVEAPPPIALAEVQGYVFDAKRRMAGLARLRGDEPLASRLEAEAEALRVRFEEAFWLPDRRYYALALDADKRPADAITSNPGHCLWSGIVAPDRARDVADRLLSPELFSGWGIRTYAADQPGYNPIGYHTGTVWPHDSAIIAAGLKRYGFHADSNRLVGSLFEAAQRFPDFRLPELFCGFDRETAPIPVPYPVACSPQAWAAGAPFQFLETMLGLRPHADRGELELTQPHLPEWLGRVNLTNLRVGDAAVDLLFHHWRGTTSAEVLRKVGPIAITIRL